MEETQSPGRQAIARAVVAYCDGKQVKTFVGERAGKIAERPVEAANFTGTLCSYLMTLTGVVQGVPTQEIVESKDLGLAYKMTVLSQSSMAMKAFLEHRLQAGDPELWR